MEMEDWVAHNPRMTLDLPYLQSANGQQRPFSIIMSPDGVKGPKVFIPLSLENMLSSHQQIRTLIRQNPF